MSWATGREAIKLIEHLARCSGRQEVAVAATWMRVGAEAAAAAAAPVVAVTAAACLLACLLARTDKALTRVSLEINAIESSLHGR